MTLQTEYEFFLPKGFVDDDGVVHRSGTMRLATARDELEPLRDPRVRDAEDPFLTIIVLARVVTGLGTLSQVTTREIERLFAADLAYLQDVYGAINFGTDDDIADVLDDAEDRRRAAANPVARRRPRREATLLDSEQVIDLDADNAAIDLSDSAAHDTTTHDTTADDIDADALAAQLQARFGDHLDSSDNHDELDDADHRHDGLDDKPAPAYARRRSIEEVGTRAH